MLSMTFGVEGIKCIQVFVYRPVQTYWGSKSTIYWDIMPCSPLKVNWHFCSACHLFLHWFFARLTLRPWRWRRYVPPKRRLTFNGLHGVISRKIVLFITTAVRTSDPTYMVRIIWERYETVLWLTANFMKQVGWKGNASDMKSRGRGSFRISAATPIIPTQDFRDSPQSLQANARKVGLS
jgi:hypothetical protein